MSVPQIIREQGAIPVYRQISQALRRDIQHFYKAGDALPPEFELAQRYSVNRHTLRRAVDELVSDGLVVRRHGKGVFVLAPTIDYLIGPGTRFTDTIESLGMHTHSRVVRKQVIPAQGRVAAKLALDEGESVIFVETLRQVENKPFCLCSHFLHLNEFPLVLERYDEGSLHQFIFQQYDKSLQRMESLVSAVMPEPEDALLLNMPRNQPVLRAKSVNVCMRSGRPLEYVVTRFRGDAAQLAFQPT